MPVNFIDFIFLFISYVEKLKNLSERGLRFSGDKSKTIGQPTPDSHPHLMEEDESKYYRQTVQRINCCNVKVAKNKYSISRISVSDCMQQHFEWNENFFTCNITRHT